LKGQQIDYSRGKGLGGSTAIHFCAWIAGADEDFNEWSRLVGDNDFNWSSVKEKLRRIENFHSKIPKSYEKWINPKAEGM
jgi:choline dehydrogenase-like flavoprotein